MRWFDVEDAPWIGLCREEYEDLCKPYHDDDDEYDDVFMEEDDESVQFDK